MFEGIKRFFQSIAADGAGETDAAHDVRVATCALFLEMARIDESFTRAEQTVVLSILQREYGLAEKEAEALLAAADRELQESVDYWQFARLINENYSEAEKLAIVEMLWKIVYVDGKLDKYEDYLMHKVANLLRLPHTLLIEAKLKVLYGSPAGSVTRRSGDFSD